jgi:hypothetical protein
MGIGAGMSVWLVSSLLSLLLLPRKEIALLFALIFGLYPILKGLIEALRRPLPQEWTLKLLAANGQLAAGWVVLRGALLSGVRLPLGLLWLGANFFFVCYDIAFTRALSSALKRLKKVR